MRFKFILKLFIVFMPVITALCFIEYGLTKMNTQYYTKRMRLEARLNEIEILSLGSSNAYYGINPQFFERPGFNLAFLAQSMYYDQQLMLKYLDRMPNLKVVILPATLYTMGTELSTTTENWRMYFYRQYFNLPLESKLGQLIDWSFLLEAKNYSKIALFGERSYGYVARGFQDKLDAECSERGWFNAGFDHGDLLKNSGFEAAKAHSLTNSTLYSKNLAYWGNIVVRLKERKIVPILLLMPSLASYHDNLDPVLFNKMENDLKEFAEIYQIEFHDYTKDSRFVFEDYTVLPDHLNALGAEKFSKIINNEIITPAIDRQRLQKITCNYLANPAACLR